MSKVPSKDSNAPPTSKLQQPGTILSRMQRENIVITDSGTRINLQTTESGTVITPQAGAAGGRPAIPGTSTEAQRFATPTRIPGVRRCVCVGKSKIPAVENVSPIPPQAPVPQTSKIVTPGSKVRCVCAAKKGVGAVSSTPKKISATSSKTPSQTSKVSTPTAQGSKFSGSKVGKSARMCGAKRSKTGEIERQPSPERAVAESPVRPRPDDWSMNIQEMRSMQQGEFQKQTERGPQVFNIQKAGMTQNIQATIPSAGAPPIITLLEAGPRRDLSPQSSRNVKVAIRPKTGSPLLSQTSSAVTERQPDVVERQVSPPKMQSPVGLVDAKQAVQLERQAVLSPREAVMTSKIVDTRMVSPGVAKQIEMMQKERLTPSAPPGAAESCVCTDKQPRILKSGKRTPQKVTPELTRSSPQTGPVRYPTGTKLPSPQIPRTPQKAKINIPFPTQISPTCGVGGNVPCTAQQMVSPPQFAALEQVSPFRATSPRPQPTSGYRREPLSPICGLGGNVACPIEQMVSPAPTAGVSSPMREFASGYRREILSPTLTPPQRQGQSPEKRSPSQPQTSPIRLDISTPVPTTGAIDINTIRNLINEENEDAVLLETIASPLEEKLQKMRKKPHSARILEETLEHSMLGQEDNSLMTSDIVAALMDSEEKGIIDTKKSPKRIYDTLFPVVGDEAMIGVSSVTPVLLHDIVVPVGEVDPENLTVGDNALAEVATKLPEGNAYAENIAKLMKNDKEKKKLEAKQKSQEKEREERRKRHAKLKDRKKDNDYIPSIGIEEEKAPWDIMDIGSLEDLVGGQASILSGDDTHASDESIRATAGRLEYILECERPQHYSRVQLRGSQAPSWFPGYYSVFPHVPNYVQIERTPSGPLAVAWNVFAPQSVQNDSEIIII